MIRKYLLPSAPCRICLPSGIALTFPDGVVTINEEDLSSDNRRTRMFTNELLEHVEGMLLVGNCIEYNESMPIPSAAHIPVQIDPNTGTASRDYVAPIELVNAATRGVLQASNPTVPIVGAAGALGQDQVTAASPSLGTLLAKA